jgi:anti-sigma B factor antagonist
MAAAKMTNDELSIDLKTENGGGTLVFKLRGSLDLATAPTVRAALTDAAEKSSRDLIVDLTQLEFLDSTGLGVLIGAHRRAAERNGSFRLIISDGPISRLLNITGLIGVFAVYHSIEDARNDRARVSASL